MPSPQRRHERRAVRPAVAVAVAVAAGALALAGCGTTEPPTEATEASDAATQAAGPVTVTDGRDKEVTLDAPATRVVALEWGQVEDVVTLGVQPVGVADIKGYGSWVTSAELTGDPVDVGIRTEPSVESVAAADPDLILGIVGSIPDGAMAQMEKIAPVVLLTAADASDPLGQMEENFTTTAALLGKQAQAKDELAKLDDAVASGKAAISDAGAGGTPFVFSYIYQEGNGFSLRMHGPGSQPIALATELGLTPAWTDNGDPEWGLSTLDLEGLTQLPEDTLFTYWGNDDTEDPLTSLDGNALWESLPFVTAGAVHEAANGIWVYGGPASSIQWVEDVVDIATP
jgi:iron complex transport system substrate-binding protein